jgi:hypothetical protein
MKKIAIAFAALSMMALSACGDGTKSACEEYLAHYNDLECTGTALSDTYCDSEDGSVCERADYWTCLKDGTSCDGDVPSIDTGDCSPACN